MAVLIVDPAADDGGGQQCPLWPEGIAENQRPFDAEALVEQVVVELQASLTGRVLPVILVPDPGNGPVEPDARSLETCS